MLFYCEGDQAQARLPREVVKSPTLEIFRRSHLDMILGDQLWVSLLEQGGLAQMTSTGPF